MSRLPAISHSKFEFANTITYILIPSLDMIQKLLFCYLCWIEGASGQLKRFDCLLIENGQGGFLIKDKLVPQ